MRILAGLLKRFPFMQRLLRRAAKQFGGRFTAGVVGIIRDHEGRILIVEHVFHPNHPWGLPGGWLESGERPAEGVAREILEETGLEVEVLRPLLADISKHDPNHLDIAFLCEARGEVTMLSHELLDYAWVYPHEAPTLFDFHQAALDTYRAEDLVEEITP